MKPQSRQEPLTFARLVALEPRLDQLRREAYRFRFLPKGTPFCANEAWYGYGGYWGLKRRLLLLVGWLRKDKHPVLSSSAAYDVAYDTIYHALPNCRRCGSLELS